VKVRPSLCASLAESIAQLSDCTEGCILDGAGQCRPRLVSLSASVRSALTVRLHNIQNPLQTAEFDPEVYRLMREREETYKPDPNYFRRQSSIRPVMRTTVIDWLVTVHKNLKLHTDTLFTAVTLLDLTLSRIDFPKSKFQLLSCVTLVLAAKGEEVHSPTPERIVKMTGNAYTVQEFAEIEAHVIEALESQVNPVQPCHFMKRFLRLMEPDTTVTMLAHYVNETALLDESVIGLRPSLRAAAAVAVALTMCNGPNQWTDNIKTSTGYSQAELQPMADLLLASVHQFGSSNYQAIRMKYGLIELAAVSEMHFPDSIQLE
jgi:hypothetical protein